MTVAAIDCGTNSTRLLVSDEKGRTVERLMRITGLGRGVDATGRLGDGIGRTVAVLREYREVMDWLGADQARVVATSAARDAANRDEFFDAAEAAIGVRPELLAGEEEGRLSFAGATADLDPNDGPFLVVDIGGGSTEFVLGSPGVDAAAIEVVSFDIGCVRMTEKYLHHDPPQAQELAQLISVARVYLEDLTRMMPGARSARLVGLAGTVSTMAMIEMGLADYDRDRVHHFELTHTAAEEVFRTVATERRADRMHNPGLDAERADIIVGGAAILVTIMRHLEVASCLVSESDILDGLVASQLHPEPRQ